MCLHDIIAEELTDKKSLAALIYLICHGRELEFEIEGKEYFISCDKSQFLYGIIRMNKVLIVLMN